MIDQDPENPEYLEDLKAVKLVPLLIAMLTVAGLSLVVALIWGLVRIFF